MIKQISKEDIPYKGQIGGAYENPETGDLEISPIKIDENGNLTINVVDSIPASGINVLDDVKPILVDYGGRLIFITYAHDLVHQQKINTLSHTFLDVISTGTVNVLLRTNSKALHFEINYNADLKCRIKTKKLPSVTVDGTAWIPFNRVIGDVDESVDFESYLNATYTGGIIRGDDFSGSSQGAGTNAVRAGGSGSGLIESVLLPNKELIIEFQNAGTVVSDIGVVINCYEI